MRVFAWGMAVVLAVFAASVLVPVSVTHALVPSRIPADGNASARVRWTASNIYGKPVPYYPAGTRLEITEGADKVRLIGSASRDTAAASFEVALQTRTEPGAVVMELRDGDTVHDLRLELVPSGGDSDRDGIPDGMELVSTSDRNAFRSWFCAIAEAQFYLAERRWAHVHRDCAGLVRFAFKEALRAHDRAWLAGARYLHHANHPDVRRYNYPELPLVGDRVFRSRGGSFDPDGQIAGQFSASASARVLWEHNTVFVSRQLEDAHAGDLLFFRDPARHDSPMHTMVLLDAPARGDLARVVYHTGRDGQDPGEVRMVQLSDLAQHRDERWHVRPDNPHFLGFYRWKILDGGRP